MLKYQCYVDGASRGEKRRHGEAEEYKINAWRIRQSETCPTMQVLVPSRASTSARP